MTGRRRVMLEFADVATTAAAIRRLRAARLHRLRAYTPFPAAEIDEALPHRRSRLPAITLGGALLGAVLGIAMEYVTSAIDYPLNIGGRPVAAWPAFGPILFETTVGGAVLAAFFGFFFIARLPLLYHPVFAVPGFAQASQDRFFLEVAFAAEESGLDTLLADCRPTGIHELAE